MTAYRWPSCLALLTLGIAAAGTAARVSVADQRQPAPPLVTSSAATSAAPEPVARVVQIDAVVTDRQGRPILDLGPEDFEVVENGVVQKLNAVELRRPAGAPAGPFEPIASAEDERRAARQPGTRVIALLLDEFHVSPGPSSDRVRGSLMRFVDEQLRASDLVAVLKPLDPVTEIRFTRDRAIARAAIESFSGRKDDFEARTEFEKKYIGRAPAAVQAARAQIVLSGLRALTSRLGELGAGRSAVVLVTEGFTASGRRRSERRVPDVQGLIRSASRSNVAMYTFDPAGVPEPARRAAADADDNRSGFLQTLAGQTGGVAVMSADGLGAGLQRVSRDLDGYYLISYTSSHTGDGRFYDVQVRARPAGAHVRTRTGYWAPVRTEPLHAADRRNAPVRVVRKSPLIDTWLGLTVEPDGAQHVTFTWVPAESRGRQRAAIQRPSVVALRVTTTEGAVLFDGELTAPRARLAAVPEDAAYFEAQPGRIQLDLTIFAADGSHMDQAAHDVDVPDANRADPLILPPQVYGSSSAREFRRISSDAAAAPVPSREFRRTERLLIRVPTHSSSGAAVAVSARVMNRTGQVLRDVKPMRAGNGTIIQFDLPLSWLAPGEYSIELTATNTAGSAKEVVRIRVTG